MRRLGLIVGLLTLLIGLGSVAACGGDSKAESATTPAPERPVIKVDADSPESAQKFFKPYKDKVKSFPEVTIEGSPAAFGLILRVKTGDGLSVADVALKSGVVDRIVVQEEHAYDHFKPGDLVAYVRTRSDHQVTKSDTKVVQRNVVQVVD